MTNWLDPLNKIRLQEAFKQKATRVTLRDGREFRLDYTRRPGFVLISPVRGLAPMGWFDLSKVTHSSWLTLQETVAAPPMPVGHRAAMEQADIIRQRNK